MAMRALVRLSGVEGSPRSFNDLLYLPSLNHHLQQPPSTVIFFPGDVQNYTDIMEKDREHKGLLKWSLENVGSMLQQHFKENQVIIIKPSRLESKTYSCYDHFVKCDVHGTPEHGNYIRALPHLEQLLQSASSRLTALNEISTSILPEGPEVKFNESNIHIIGFSKGCVVLNQLVHEMCTDMEGLFLNQRLTSLSWLDSGHSGTFCAYITSKPLLQLLANMGLELRVEVTPYQVGQRPWLAKEEEIFTRTLREFGANISRRLHFSNSPPTLINHFRLLDVCFSPD